MDDAKPTGAGGAHRLFFALWPGDDVRDALARAARGVDLFRDTGRRVAPDKYHLTLHFVGNWSSRPDGIVDRARTAAASIAARGFHLVVDHAGAFRGARVGWLAPSGNSGLDALWAQLRRALDDAGVPRQAHERFSPHITVLRDLRTPVPETGIAPISWPVDDFVLVHSHDGGYEVIDRWPLARG